MSLYLGDSKIGGDGAGAGERGRCYLALVA